VNLRLVAPQSEEAHNPLSLALLPLQLHVADFNRLLVQSSQHNVVLQLVDRRNACCPVYMWNQESVPGSQQISRIWATS
jgi:hypothetical protein